MQVPVFRSCRRAKICYKISTWMDGITYKLFLRPCLFVLPVTMLVVVVTDSDIFKRTLSSFPEDIQNIFFTNHLILIALIYGLIIVGSSIEGLIRHLSKPDCELTREDLQSILTCINEVVVGKMQRFLSSTRVALRDSWQPEKIFTEITQPRQQIALQIKALHGFFEYFTQNKVRFRVGLMRIADSKPLDWSSFFPDEHPPRATIEALSSPTSTIMRALERGDTIIVQDINAELKKKNKDDRNFVAAGSKPGRNGSILTHPIYCPNTRNPIYVLSIFAEESDCLLEKHIGTYKWIIENFLTRILIEHHLLILKEGVDCERKQ